MVKSPQELQKLFPCWETLTPDQQRRLTDTAEDRHFSKGQLLHQGGNDCAGLFVVREGQLRVFILSESGKEVTLYRLFAQDICLFSASCIMREINFDLHVSAEKDTQVLIVPAAVYEELMKSSLPVADYTNQLMSARFSDVMWTIGQILFTSVDSRLAAFLLDESHVEQADELRITHDEIARHMGSAREVVTKMLNYLANEGMIHLSRGKITLLDRAKLKKLVQ